MNGTSGFSSANFIEHSPKTTYSFKSDLAKEHLVDISYSRRKDNPNLIHYIFKRNGEDERALYCRNASDARSEMVMMQPILGSPLAKFDFDKKEWVLYDPSKTFDDIVAETQGTDFSFTSAYSPEGQGRGR